MKRRRAPPAPDGGLRAPHASLLDLELGALVAELSPPQRLYDGALAAVESCVVGPAQLRTPLLRVHGGTQAAPRWREPRACVRPYYLCCPTSRFRLRGAFSGLPARAVDAAAHAAAFPALPLLRLTGDSAKLNFEPPARVTLVGSFASCTVAKVRRTVNAVGGH